MFRRRHPLAPQSEPSPKRVWIYFVLALCLIIFLAAVTVLFITARLQQKSLSAAPQYSADDLYNQAVQQADQGDYTTSQQYLEQALQQKDDDTYRSQLAVVEYQLKEYPEAIAQYQTLIAAGTDAAFAWNGIGNAYRDWGAEKGADKATDNASAVDAYNKSITLDAQYTAAYSNLALLLASEGQKTEAIAVLDKGIAATSQDVLKTVEQNIKSQ